MDPGRRRSPRWRAIALLLAGVLAGTMLLTPAGAHFTQNTKHLGRHAWHQFIKDKVYTRAEVDRNIRMWARVTSTGTLAQSEGPVVGAERITDPGRYRVEFSRPVLGCSAQATAWSSAQRVAIPISLPGEGVLPNANASVGAFFPPSGGLPTSPNPNVLSVGLRNSDGDFVNSAFTLSVIC